MTMTEKKPKYALLILSFIFLFHPNVHIIDILPDFIAFYLISKLLERAADSSPYFEEARAAFIKLMWVSIVKLPALVMVVNLGGMQGDLVALVALSFAIADMLLSLSAVRYLFDAIFYLGERSAESALLSPFPIGKGRSLSPEAYRSATYLFVIVKYALATLPEFLRLTRGDSVSSTVVSYDFFYPLTVVLVQLLALTVGAIWLVRSIRYARHTVLSGAFDRAIDEMQGNSHEQRYTARYHQRVIFSGFAVLAISAFLTVLLRPGAMGGAPIIPTLLFPLVFTYGIFLLRRYLTGTRTLYVLGLSASVLGLVSFVMSSVFFEEYTLHDMLKNEAARAQYMPIQILCTVECILACAMLVCFALSMRTLIRSHTGAVHITDEYRESDRIYHTGLYKRVAIFSLLGVAVMLCRCAEVIFYGIPKQIGVGQFEEIQSTIVTPMVPWFGTMCGFVALAFILYSLYLFSLLKDEVKLKYE